MRILGIICNLAVKKCVCCNDITKNMEKEEYKAWFVSKETRMLLTKECLDFYYSESEKKLSDLINTSHIITQRAYTFSGMLLTIFIALAGVICSQPSNKFIYLCATIGIICTGLSLYIIFKRVLSPHEYWSVGKSPKGFNINGFIDYYNIIKRDAYINIVCDELYDIQRKIEKNTQANKKRAHDVGLAMNIMMNGVYTIAAISIITAIVNFFY